MRLLALPLLACGLIALLGMLMIPIWIMIVIAVWRFVMPWLFVGLMIWVAFAISGGSRRRQRRWVQRYNRWAPPARMPTPSKPEPRLQPEPQPQPQSRPELPIDVQVKIEQIRRKVEVLLGYAPRFPPFSQDLYVVRQTAVDYLPRTVDAYLVLPPDEAERAVDASGKTAHQELKEQLDLLDLKLDEIAEDLQRQNLDRLLANRRFLEERFGRKSA